MAWYDEYGAAWNAHDPEAVVAFMTDDAVYEDMALGKRSEGHEQIKAFVDQVTGGLSSHVEFEYPDPISVTDDAYALEWILRGVHDRASDILPASGKPFEIHGVSVGRIRDGKIVWNRDYWSMGEFLTQIGILPPITV